MNNDYRIRHDCCPCVERLRAELARYDQQDRIKTREINILVRENRDQAARIAELEGLFKGGLHNDSDSRRIAELEKVLKLARNNVPPMIAEVIAEVIKDQET